MSEIDLQRQIDKLAGLLEDLKTGEGAKGRLVDYFASSTKVGWSAYTASNLSYVLLGGLVYAFFYIEGTSNNVATTVTLPYSNAAGFMAHNVIQVIDNGTAAFGRAQIASGVGVITFLPDAAGGAWTASGTKRVLGEVVYKG